jgi:hypothetical protein
VEFEQADGKFEVTTLYKMLRKLESEGNPKITLSYTEIKRPAERKPGTQQVFEHQHVSLTLKMCMHCDKIIPGLQSSRVFV